METMGGSSDSLMGMPGDLITYREFGGFVTKQTIKVAGWQPGPKGGKIWTYETVDGQIVPHTSVLKIEKLKIAEAFLDSTDIDKVVEHLEEAAILVAAMIVKIKSLPK